MAVRKQKRRRTVHDVAKEAGVSIATVSYVLNDRGSVSEDVRKKVRRAATKIGYRQNRAARAMKMGRTDILGLVIPNIENPFFATLAQSVLQECKRQKYQVFLVDTEGSHESEAKAMHGLVAQGVDGIIVFPIDDSELGPAAEFEVPVVVLDRDTPEMDLVQAEYFEGGRLLGEHLVNLGHRRFGFLEGPQDVASARARSNGVIDALSKDCKIVWREEHPFAMSLTKSAQDRLGSNDVTAVVCGNDLIAMATIVHLQARKVNVPGNVSVVGFDDIQFATMISPTLTTVHMPIAAMGVEAVNLLVRRLAAEKQDESRSRIVLNVKLVIRESSGPAALRQ